MDGEGFYPVGLVTGIFPFLLAKTDRPTTRGEI